MSFGMLTRPYSKEREKEALVASAKSFDELKEAIEKIGDIENLKGFYNDVVMRLIGVCASVNEMRLNLTQPSTYESIEMSRVIEEYKKMADERSRRGEDPYELITLRCGIRDKAKEVVTQVNGRTIDVPHGHAH
jgi:GTP1/Obg family GTP-binding protein